MLKTRKGYPTWTEVLVIALAAVLATFALVFVLAAYAGEPLPTIPDSRPDKDQVVKMCEDGHYVYAHAWHEQKIMIFGTVYKGGKHDPPDVVLTWKDKNTPDKLWHHGVQVPDAITWLDATDFCDFAK